METEFNFFTLILQIIFYYLLFNFIAGFLAGYFKNRNEEVEGQIREKIAHLNEIIHIVETEQHGEITYWFDAGDNEFLGQGKTYDEIVAHVKSRFPDHVFILKQQEQNYQIGAPEWKPVPIKQN